MLRKPIVSASNDRSEVFIVDRRGVVLSKSAGVWKEGWQWSIEDMSERFFSVQGEEAESLVKEAETSLSI